MIKINLLPYRDERKKELIKLQAVFVAVPMLLVIMVFVVLWITNNAMISSTEKDILLIKKQIADCTLKMKEIEDYKLKKDVLLKKMDVISNLQKGKDGPVHLLDELATCIPGNIWLTSVSQKGTVLELEGSALDNIAVSNYMINLGKSPYLRDVDLKTIMDQTTEKAKNILLKKFIITCNLTYIPGKTG